MTSRYLFALESRISQATSHAESLRLRLERASYLARLGSIVAAREEIDVIRSSNVRDDTGRTTILINIADGLCHYYQSMGGESRDRLSRAYALAIATGNLELAAQAAAWLALIAYGDYNFPEMAKHLRASEVAGSGDPLSQSRNDLTKALTIHLANRYDLAREWYNSARRWATVIEDDAMISAILHNMSSIWVTNIRNARLGPIATSDTAKLAQFGVSSTENFDGIVGSTSLPVITPLTRAQLLSIGGDYQHALRLYNENMDKLDIRSSSGWQKWLVVDRGWCMLQAGERSAAQTIFESTRAALHEDDHIDDRAAALSRIAQGFTVLGINRSAEESKALADDCWNNFRKLQCDMLQMISALANSQGSGEVID